jgi:ferredoxin
MKEDGSVGVKEEFKGKEIPEDLKAKVKEAQSMCPSGAIVVEQ